MHPLVKNTIKFFLFLLPERKRNGKGKGASSALLAVCFDGGSMEIRDLFYHRKSEAKAFIAAS